MMMWLGATADKRRVICQTDLMVNVAKYAAEHGVTATVSH